MDFSSAFLPKNPMTQSAQAGQSTDPLSPNEQKTTPQPSPSPEMQPRVAENQQQSKSEQPTQPSEENRALSEEELAALYEQDATLKAAPMYGPVQEELYFEWSAESRPFKQHGKQFYTTAVTIALLISLILFFSGQILPIAVVIALFFVFYVLNSIPPQVVTHQITSFGIRCAGTLYAWEELGRFWFTTKHDKDILNIEVGRFPGRILFLLGELDVATMREIMAPLLPEQEPDRTTFEKMGAWLQETFPIDLESSKG